MQYRMIESALMTARREHNLARVDELESILLHKKKVLDVKLEKTMIGSTFEKRAPFQALSKEYSEVARLFKVVNYARS